MYSYTGSWYFYSEGMAMSGKAKLRKMLDDTLVRSFFGNPKSKLTARVWLLSHTAKIIFGLVGDDYNKRESIMISSWMAFDSMDRESSMSSH